MRRAVVVAHPDDETLWFGGLLIAEEADDWTVICCSIPKADPIRAWKFFDACQALGARGRLLPFAEGGKNEPLAHLDALDLAGFDQVVTHNAEGEYGHRHHVQVHQHCLERAAGRVVVGGYGARAPGERRIALTASQMERKMAALRAYDHVSPTDGRPKWEALIARYGAMFDLSVETYARA